MSQPNVLKQTRNIPDFIEYTRLKTSQPDAFKRNQVWESWLKNTPPGSPGSLFNRRRRWRGMDWFLSLSTGLPSKVRVVRWHPQKRASRKYNISQLKFWLRDAWNNYKVLSVWLVLKIHFYSRQKRQSTKWTRKRMNMERLSKNRAGERWNNRLSSSTFGTNGKPRSRPKGFVRSAVTASSFS